VPGTAPGALIGPYKIVRLLGEGGMGVVYQAQQVQPIRREVALKIIKPGMDSRQVIARFESERQALAVMDHANIARVFDAGTTAAGLPYFAMELVDGIPITRYCDSKRLTVKKRLELFIPICRAIQHAHQKGIIHRDIKPSNILLSEQDGKPVPKVIDFGLAKALGPHGADATAITNLGTIVGTLGYMSPEQAELTRLDVDTRSDVYSLGAVLYELLTGTTPLEREYLAKAGYVEALQRIREADSPSPSERLRRSTKSEQIAVERQSDPAHLPKVLDGELDWITMKALEKDRGRRYETANALARDLERYLAGEPVEAAPPSATYRLGKFARKHSRWLGAAAAFVVLLVAGVVLSSWLTVRARRAEQEARAVCDFLRNDLLAQADAASQTASGERDADIKVRTLLERAAADVSRKFGGQPQVEAAIRSTIADAYLGLGLFKEARQQAERAVELRRRVLGPEHRDTLASLATLGRAEYHLGELQQAEALHTRLLEVQKRRLGPEHPDSLETMSALAVDYFGQSKHKQAEELDRKVIDIRTRLLGPDDPKTLASLNQLANDLTSQGQYARAEEVQRKVFEASRRKLGGDHPDTVSALNDLAVMLYYQAKYPEAAKLLDEVLETQRRVHGPEHPLTLTAMANLSVVYGESGDFERQLALDIQIADGYRKTQGPDSVLTGVAVHNLGTALIDMGRYAEAEPVIREALAMRTRNFGAENQETLITKDHLGLIRRGQHRYTEAAEIHREVLEVERRAPGPKHPNTLTTMYRLARVLAEDHRYAEAEALDRQATELLQSTLGPGHPKTLAATNHLASILESEGKAAETESLLRAALGVFEKERNESWQRFNCESLLGSSLAGQHKYEAAEPLLVAGYTGMAERASRMTALDRDYLKLSGDAVITMYRDWQKPAKAEEWRRRLSQAAH
jgi:non-specific serine/threonine protein kinase/serine/threonine-protein kinase